MKHAVRRIKIIKGEIGVPGDKSISHRAVMIGSIAEGITEIHGFSSALDCRRTIDCIRSCGGNIDFIDENRVIIYGKGLKGLTGTDSILDAGNSGTTMRLLSGMLCAQDFDSVITGDRSLRMRPMDRIIKPLSMMGADIHGTGNGKHAPLYIKGSKLAGINYTMEVNSAQVKSAILLASLYAEGKTVIYEPCPSRNHTEIMLRRFGAHILVDGTQISSSTSYGLEPQNITVPGDISAAAYFIVAALIIPDSKLTIKNVGINPTRDGIIKVLKSMGGSIDVYNIYECGGELFADISVRYSSLKGTHIGGKLIPALIDEIPILCVAAAFANGTTVISDAEELKYKESNRINAMVSNLRSIGADVEEKEDGFIIHGNREMLHGNLVNGFDDHRIVMAMAVAGAALHDGVIIDDISSVGVSFPEFFKILEGLSS